MKRIFRIFFFFLFCVFILVPTTFAQGADPLKSTFNQIIEELIGTEKEITHLKDFGPLQKLVGQHLIVFTSPGAMVNSHSFEKSELKGWVKDKDWANEADWIHSTKWTLYELTYYLKPLPKRQLIVLSKKPCPTFAHPNENCPDPKRLHWFDRWVLYPGDYLCDVSGACQTLPAERTLIYYSPQKNAAAYYFGFRQEKAGWILHSIYHEDIGIDSGV